MKFKVGVKPVGTESDSEKIAQNLEMFNQCASSKILEKSGTFLGEYDILGTTYKIFTDVPP